MIAQVRAPNLLRRLCSAAVLCLTAIADANAQGAAAQNPASVQQVAEQQGTTLQGRAPWWRYATIYEIYPRSFQDSNGDGVGDLRGIVQRLDYLESLGVDAIWLTPVYPSPQVDFGYDISDYTAIDPRYGTMADFDLLVAEAKKRHIRVLMDLVLNHSSDKHPWFVESAKSRTNPKRDWYIWRDGKTGADGKPQPPNNWRNRIDQSAWQYDPATKQWYYHYFATEQPDLNFRNPAVERAMLDVVRFWYDKGVDGFRLDAINTMFEDEQLRDEPALPGTNEYGEPSLSQVRQRNLPETHDVLRRLRTFSDGFDGNRLLVGEVYTGGTAEMARWYGANNDEIQLPMDTGVGFLNKLDATGFRKLLAEADALGPARTPLYVFDNHDRPRSWDRYGDGVHNEQIARMLAAVLLLTRSSSLVYQGQELGMQTQTPTRKEDVRDPRGLAGWPQEKGRDGERTPMQWDASPNAGFTAAAQPWLPIEPSHVMRNVTTESSQEDSLLNWYRALISLKRNDPAAHSGTTIFLDTDKRGVLGWVRRSADDTGMVVLCNMSAQPATIDLSRQPGLGERAYVTALSSTAVSPDAQHSFTLNPYQSVVISMSSAFAATKSEAR